MKEFNFEKTNQELMEFLDNSPSSFHAVANMKAMLEEAGCSCLLEGEKWQLEPGKGYYVTRNCSDCIPDSQKGFYRISGYGKPQRFPCI